MSRFAVLAVLLAATACGLTLSAEAPTPPPVSDVAAYASSLPIGSTAPAFNVTEVKGGKVLCFL